MSARAELRKALLVGAPWGPKGLGFADTLDAFESAIRSDLQALLTRLVRASEAYGELGLDDWQVQQFDPDGLVAAEFEAALAAAKAVCAP